MGHNVTPNAPSRLATWLLGRLLSEEDREAVIGDLIEECALKQPDSRLQVSWWYWSQVSRSIAPLVWIGVRREHWGAVFGAAMAAFILANVTEWVATKAIAMVVDWSVAVPVNFVVGLAAMALGGYVAAWLRPHASGIVAFLILVMVIVFMATMGVGETGPLWYHIGFLIFGPLAALAGGALLRRTRCKK